MKEYFGTFAIHGAEKITDADAQYFVAIHPHGPVAFSRFVFV
jgi:hypothetical protein